MFLFFNIQIKDLSAFYALVYPLWASMLVYYNVGVFFKNSGISIFEPSSTQLKYLGVAIC